MDEEKTCCCEAEEKKTERSDETKKKLIHRLNRIEGKEPVADALNERAEGIL